MSDRGTCRGCGYRFRLLKDGTIQSHSIPGVLWGPNHCEGSYKPPVLSASSSGGVSPGDKT